MDRSVLMSIKPRFALRILQGEKRIEFRRSSPRFGPGSTVFVYISSPVQEVSALFTIDEIVSGPVELIWRRYRRVSGLSKREFFEYYAGSRTAYGIRIAQIFPFSTPLSLEQLKEMLPEFVPPQNYRYINPWDPPWQLLRAQASSPRQAPPTF